VSALEPRPSDTQGSADEGPFVATLRSRSGVIRLSAEGEAHLTIRVEVPEVWDVVRIETAPTTPLRTIKTRALQALYPDYADGDAFVMKLNGTEMRDEDASVSSVGAKDGSTFLLSFRRRRPVKS
jgi:hypothetical protein